MVSVLPLNTNLNGAPGTASLCFLRSHFPWHIRNYHSEHKILISSRKEKTQWAFPIFPCLGKGLSYSVAPKLLGCGSETFSLWPWALFAREPRRESSSFGIPVRPPGESSIQIPFFFFFSKKKTVVECVKTTKFRER